MSEFEADATQEELEVGLDAEGDAEAGLPEDQITDAQRPQLLLERQRLMSVISQQELEQMKERLAEMENEANKLREMQAKVEEQAGLAPSGSAAADASAKEDADARSVYVGNVDYACTPEELQMHFQGCGTVNRVTILTDKWGNSKAYAYIEFLEPEAVDSALVLDGSDLRGRQLKVAPKRTNVPGMKAYRGGPYGRGGRGRGRGGRGYGGYGGGYGGYGGWAPRGRGRGRWYSPY